jgi:hypothetical protein
MENNFPFFPTRFCEKMTGPFPDNLMQIVSISITGDNKARQNSVAV